MGHGHATHHQYRDYLSSDNKPDDSPGTAIPLRRVVATEPAPSHLSENLSAADVHYRRRRERGREDGPSVRLIQ